MGEEKNIYMCSPILSHDDIEYIYNIYVHTHTHTHTHTLSSVDQCVYPHISTMLS